MNGVALTVFALAIAGGAFVGVFREKLHRLKVAAEHEVRVREIRRQLQTPGATAAPHEPDLRARYGAELEQLVSDGFPRWRADPLKVKAAMRSNDCAR
jgi:hypothetical protein